jgi:hypothetical protein
MQNAGLALAAICDSFRHSLLWCHQYPPVLTSSAISRDADLSHRAIGHAALFFATLRKFYFLSPVDSTHLCSSTFAFRLGTQLRLGLRTPCASERACYQSLGLHIFLLAAALLPWPIVATSWLPMLVPRLPHTYRLARRAARSGAVVFPHPPNHQSIHLRTYSLRVTVPIHLATSDPWSRLLLFRERQHCSPKLIGRISPNWLCLGLQIVPSHSTSSILLSCSFRRALAPYLS